MICPKCKARLTEIQKKLEEIGFKYGDDKFGASEEQVKNLPGPWDIAELAKLLHEVCAILGNTEKKETLH